MQFTGPVQDRKLVIVGDGGCGKTSLLIVYSRGHFPEMYVPTVFDNYTAELTMDKKRVQLALWDTAGQEDYDRLRPLSYPDTDVILLCFSIDSRPSFDNIQEKWSAEVAHFCGPKMTKILVGLKSDLRANSDNNTPLVTAEEGQAMADRIGAYRYVECSAKYGDNVPQVFNEAVRGIWENEKRSGSPTSKKRKSSKTSRCCIA
jgi:small GTP-binding protein